MANLTGSYVLAHNLVGFSNTTLRCMVTDHRLGYVWVRTADLLDSCTPLTLSETQVEPLEETVSLVSHRDGLVSFR